MNTSKIILITHEYPPYRGGAGIVCEEIANSALDGGLNLEVWAPEYSKNPQVGTVNLLPHQGGQGFIVSFKLIRETIRRLKTESKGLKIHIAEPGSLRAFIRFGWLISSKYQFLATIHGSELLRFTSNPFEKWMFKKFLKKCTKIHVLSKYNRTQLTKIFPEIKSRILCLPGAPARRVSTSPSKETERVGSEQISILCVGRIHPRKGQDCLLNALIKLPQSTQEKIKITLAGPPTKKNFLEKLIRLKDDFIGEVIFKGDISSEELSSLYKMSDIFALTPMPKSKSIEGFGLVFLEASAHGLPIVAHCTGGVEDSVLDEKTGLLANPNDLESLTNKLGDLIHDKELRKRLGENGKEWALSHSWSELVKNLYVD